MAARHTLVIGGTRGIGRALVKMLAREQAAVSVIGRRPYPEEYRSIPNIHYSSVDLADTPRLYDALSEIVEQHGKLANLVFFQRYRDADDNWAGELQISLTATKNTIERLSSEFITTEGPSIVIVSSVASHFIVSEQPVGYHVAKAGLDQLVRYYAVKLGAQGIRVNGVSPSSVIKDENREFFEQHDALRQLYESITPLKRMGTADEVAQVIRFLCSSQSSYITGQNLVVDGGLSVQGHEALARQLAALDSSPITRPVEKGTQ